MVLILLSINNIVCFPCSCTTGDSTDKFYVPSESALTACMQRGAPVNFINNSFIIFEFLPAEARAAIIISFYLAESQNCVKLET